MKRSNKFRTTACAADRKNGVSRKVKKAIRNSIVIYDAESLPVDIGIDFSRVFEIFQISGWVIWDSSNGGDSPQVHPKRKGIKIVDSKNKPSLIYRKS